MDIWSNSDADELNYSLLMNDYQILCLREKGFENEHAEEGCFRDGGGGRVRSVEVDEVASKQSFKDCERFKNVDFGTPTYQPKKLGYNLWRCIKVEM